MRVESDDARDYWAPAYHPVSGRLLAHGPGPLDPGSRFESDAPGEFLLHPPLRVDLPDRDVSLIGIRGYLPAVDPTTGEVATSEAFSRLVASRPDGTGKRVLFDRTGADRYRGPDSAWGPSWSKDGQWVAFIVGPPFASAATDVDIWKVRRDGSDAMSLTPDSDANDALPDFSPDGRRIVFRSMRDGNAEIYLMNADGSEPRRLTHHEATDTMPRVLLRRRPRGVHLPPGRELRALRHRARRGRPAGPARAPHPQPRPRHAPPLLAGRRVGAVHVAALRVQRRGCRC